MKNITVIKKPPEALAQKAYFRSCNDIIFYNLSLRTLLVSRISSSVVYVLSVLERCGC